jgi:hypothetical protein
MKCHDITQPFLSLSLLSAISLSGCQMRNSLKPEEMTDSGRKLSVTYIEMTDGKTVHFDKDSLDTSRWLILISTSSQDRPDPFVVISVRGDRRPPRQLK